MDEVIVGGVYEHYKGNRYRVIGIALDSETHEKKVVYQGLYSSEAFGSQSLWVRPYELFVGSVTLGATIRPRFKYLPADQEG